MQQHLLLRQQLMDHQVVLPCNSTMDRHELLLVELAQVNAIHWSTSPRCQSGIGPTVVAPLEGEEHPDDSQVTCQAGEMERRVLLEVYSVDVVLEDVLAGGNHVCLTTEYSIVDQCVANALVFVISLGD